MSDLYAKLNEAREKFHNLELKKTGLNKFAGYNYFELGDFLIPALKVFRECNLCAVVSFAPDVATMTITDVMDTSASIVITSPMGSANLKGCHEVQNIGAVETYQRRYLWVAALEIVEHDALDATTGKDQPKPLKHGARDGIGEGLPDDIKNQLMDMATYCKELVGENNAAEAYKFIKEQKLEADQETWLANQMDSKTRNAIKAAKPQGNTNG